MRTVFFRFATKEQKKRQLQCLQKRYTILASIVDLYQASLCRMFSVTRLKNLKDINTWKSQEIWGETILQRKARVILEIAATTACACLRVLEAIYDSGCHDGILNSLFHFSLHILCGVQVVPCQRRRVDKILE